MSRRGDVYENHVTGERAVVLLGDEDPDADGRSIVHLTVLPGGAVAGEHIHPRIAERFTVGSGELGTRIAGVRRRYGPGEAATVPAGVAHDWWNSGHGDASVVVELTPLDPRFEMMIATTFGLANAGKTNAKGMPAPPQLALVAQEFADVIVFTKPPRAVQRVAFAALGAIGRRKGLMGIYPEYLKPHGHEAPDPRALEAAGLAPQSST
jgi:quercetin dioxygenase-like cupin family protein